MIRLGTGLCAKALKKVPKKRIESKKCFFIDEFL
jgi:hypothetical protein